jgi:hypothetical protein
VGQPFGIGSCSYRGSEAAFAAYRAWMDSWDEYRREPKEIVDVGNRVDWDDGLAAVGLSPDQR